MHRFFVIFGLIFVGGSVAAVDEPDDVRFSRDVLPVLSENCFFCHGPDEAQRQAELRLDTEAGAATALDRETLSDSALVRRIL